MKYYQIADKNENVEKRIMNIVKSFVVCTDPMSIELIVNQVFLILSLRLQKQKE